MFYNTEICYQGCGEKKQVFLQSFKILKGYLWWRGYLACYFNVRVALINILDRKL